MASSSPRRSVGRLSAVSAFALAWTVGCGSSSSSTSPQTGGAPGGTTVSATNTTFSLVDLFGEGDFFVFNVREEDQGGTDLNGDGDAMDRVFFVYDARTRVVRNTFLASGQPDYVTGFPEPGFGEDFVVLPVNEAQQGDTDLNGDGDTEDFVLHVFEPGTGAVQVIPRAAERFVGPIGFAAGGRHVAFTVPETAEGNVDANGDGDTDDRFVHVFDVDSGVLDRIPEAAAARLGASETSLFYSLVEDGVGDLNGDGDEDDSVVHVLDLASGAVTNVGQAAFELIEPVQGAWTFLVFEQAQGMEDLNGDLDTDDFVFASYDPQQAVLQNHGVAPESSFEARPGAGGDLIVARVSEAAMDRDLNGDGDLLDDVFHALDPITGETFNTGLAGDRAVVLGDWLGVTVDERDQGDADLNGDGVVGGGIVHAVEPRAGTVANLGALAFSVGFTSLASDGQRLLFWRGENLSTGDWNGDGDIADEVLWWWDPVTNTMARMERSGARLADARDGTALVWVEEASELEDLNDDGDTIDFLLFALELATGQLIPTGLSAENEYSRTRLVDADTALVEVREVAGFGDLNADGDDFDGILFRLELVR